MVKPIIILLLMIPIVNALIVDIDKPISANYTNISVNYSNYSNSSDFWDNLDSPTEILTSQLNNDEGFITLANVTAGNPFDQSLNTTDTVAFQQIDSISNAYFYDGNQANTISINGNNGQNAGGKIDFYNTQGSSPTLTMSIDSQYGGIYGATIYDNVVIGSAIISVDPNGRNLYWANGGNPAIVSSWADGTLKDASGNAYLTSWVGTATSDLTMTGYDIIFGANGDVITDGSYTSIDPYNRYLTGYDGYSVPIDYSGNGYSTTGIYFDSSYNIYLNPFYATYIPNGKYLQFDSSTMIKSGAAGGAGTDNIDVYNRQLKDSNGWNSIDYGVRQLWGTDGSTGVWTSLTWGYDSGNSRPYVYANLYGSGTTLLVDADYRQLSDGTNPIMTLTSAAAPQFNGLTSGGFARLDGTGVMSVQNCTNADDIPLTDGSCLSASTLGGNVNGTEINVTALYTDNLKHSNGSDWNFTTDLTGYAQYQFTTNNFNGSGNITAGTINGLVHIGGDIATYESYGLTIQSATGGMILKRLSSNEPFVYLYNTNSGSGGQMRGIDGGGIRFTTGSGTTEWMRINSAGNVGIGTASPSTKLQVNGSINITNTTGSSLIEANVSTMRVGINKANPTATLDVNGGIGASSITLAGSGNFYTSSGGYGVGSGGITYFGATGASNDSLTGSFYVSDSNGVNLKQGTFGALKIGSNSSNLSASTAMIYRNGSAYFNGTVNSAGYLVNSTVGITNSTGFWLCTQANCLTTCQVTITGGIITGCS
jgi:hypothetical protein